MNRETTLGEYRVFRLGIINAFILLGLLRLTNLNFYLSQIMGFETEINNTGGNAFNFTNYLGTAFLFGILFLKIKNLKAVWSSAWPIYVIVVIYILNYVLTHMLTHHG